MHRHNTPAGLACCQSPRWALAAGAPPHFGVHTLTVKMDVQGSTAMWQASGMRNIWHCHTCGAIFAPLMSPTRSAAPHERGPFDQ